MMIANDVLRRVRFIFDYDDSKMISLFGLGELVVTREQISNWLKKDEDPDFQKFNDLNLAIFLNGLITDKRGKRDGPSPKPEKRLTNNVILRKLTIALDMKSEDTLKIMDAADLHISKHELSAFFRKPDHKHYRPCKDQILRNFLIGLQYKYRVDIKSDD
jgi:uncharacterized protein YehS (DUF1456 family)